MPDPLADSKEKKAALNRPRGRWWRRVLVAGLWFLGAMAVVVIAAVAVFNLRAAAVLNAKLSDLLERGEPLTYAEARALMLANAPDDDDNLAKVPTLLALYETEEGLAARRLVETEKPHHLDLLDERGLHLVRASLGWDGSIRQAAEDFDKWDPELWERDGNHWEWIEHPDGPAAAVYETSAALHHVIHELAAETRHRSSSFHVWPDQDGDKWPLIPGVDTSLHQWNRILGISRTLGTVALSAIATNDPELAVAAIEVQCALTRFPSHESTSIGRLIANECARYMDVALYEGLRRRIWDESQLQRLQTALEISFPALDLEQAMRWERLHIFRKNRAAKLEPVSIAAWPDWEPPSRLDLWRTRLLPRGWFDLAAAEVLEVLDAEFIRSGTLLPVPDPPDELQLARPDEEESWNRLKDNYADLPRIIHRLAIGMRAAETRIRLGHAALAVERFHLRKGRYPTEWREMIPGELAEAPLDPFTGEAPLLLPVDLDAGRSRPVIYSPGLNRTDNGASQAFLKTVFGQDPDRPSDRAANGDVVWGYPEP